MSERPIDPNEQPEVGYPIRVVSRRTGLKQDLIRAWERRHGAVAPSRSEGRHRLYSEEDIRRLQLLRRATEAGHSIGRIAGLEESELMGLLAADARDREATSDGPSAEGNPYVAACLDAIAALDREELEAELHRALVELGRNALVDEVLVPLVRAVGTGYGEMTLRPMHEHLVSSVVASIAQEFRPAFSPADDAPHLIVSTPAHQHHDLGALLAAGVAKSEGWRSTFLGGNLPAEEIAAAAAAKSAIAIALGIVFPPADPTVISELRLLRRLVGKETAILVGGAATPSYRDILRQIGAVPITDFAQLRSILEELRRNGSPAPA